MSSSRQAKRSYDKPVALDDKLDKILGDYFYGMNKFEESDKMQDEVQAQAYQEISKLITQARIDELNSIVTASPQTPSEHSFIELYNSILDRIEALRKEES